MASHNAKLDEPVPGAQADKPQQIPIKGWVQVTKRAFKEMGQDHLSLMAGGVAYAWFLALVPGLIASVLIYGLVTDPAKVQEQVASFASGLPNDAQSLLTTQMEKIASGGGGLSVGVILSIALALWSASAGIAGLVEAINIAYDEDESRSFVKKRGLAILLTIGFLIFIGITIGLVAVLPIVLDSVGLGIVGQFFIGIGRFVALIFIMLVAVSLLYRIGPDRDAPKFRWATPGAIIATLLWIVASIAFSLYVDNFSSYNETYGALAGVVVLLLWFWITALVVLLGAEINAEAEAQTAKDTTKGPAEPMGQRGAVKADEPPPHTA
ncbi:MAG: YihY/virulence factor BrkB family protein [Nocardioidaceae bacterium]|nr:YihY/virulence factor BrkB family protein [Nocardioidaceae bacterium]